MKFLKFLNKILYICILLVHSFYFIQLNSFIKGLFIQKPQKRASKKLKILVPFCILTLQYNTNGAFGCWPNIMFWFRPSKGKNSSLAGLYYTNTCHMYMLQLRSLRECVRCQTVTGRCVMKDTSFQNVCI